MNPLFTIGHSTHDFARFLGLLNQHGIQVVADVRNYVEQPQTSSVVRDEPWNDEP